VPLPMDSHEQLFQDPNLFTRMVSFTLDLSYCDEFLYASISCNFWTEFEFIA